MNKRVRIGKKKLKTLLAIAEADPRFTKKCVAYCYPAGHHFQLKLDKAYRRVKVEDLTAEELNERWSSTEWWIEDEELCLCRGR